ncbi:GMP/IMP nucleotidase [Pseudomaricurvus sp. HS19]|uniref:GMP/IMP nucleotidase n=1 Tax=Pseudomaricurvus sp. HS19 TaxID=2692626 RepID=UPI00136D4C30|nr:GMP/IMP nucleotidase [Pseudomaricurvus sp. HS19]MYM63678.1 GMP/IMP nucleotidase [Pseudomaricurvus sp. HS19]
MVDINWAEIDTVLLDMDGTLLDLHFDNYFWLTHLPKRYAETHGVDEAEAMEKLHAHIKAHEGTLKWYCLEFWSESLQLDVRALKEEVKDKIAVRPFVMEFLQALRAHNKRLVLITNSHPQGLDLKLQVTEIDRWLHMVISSHEFQQPKEAQEFWQMLHQREPFDPERTLFIDDTVRILDSAKQFGIRHLLCLHQPDSQREHRGITEYPAIHHFDEIMPSLEQS